MTSLDEKHRSDILKSTQNNSKILGTYISQGFDDGTLRSIDVTIAQNILSGAVEASPDLAHWTADNQVSELSAAYFNLFVNGLSLRKKNNKR